MKQCFANYCFLDTKKRTIEQQAKVLQLRNFEKYRMKSINTGKQTGLYQTDFIGSKKMNSKAMHNTALKK